MAGSRRRDRMVRRLPAGSWVLRLRRLSSLRVELHAEWSAAVASGGPSVGGVAARPRGGAQRRRTGAHGAALDRS